MKSLFGFILVLTILLALGRACDDTSPSYRLDLKIRIYYSSGRIEDKKFQFLTRKKSPYDTSSVRMVRGCIYHFLDNGIPIPNKELACGVESFKVLEYKDNYLK